MSDDYKANFLWPYEDGSIEEAGYEFRNGMSEEYVKQWWETLLERTSDAALRSRLAAETQRAEALIARAYFDGIQKGKFGVVENGTTGALELADVYAARIVAALAPSAQQMGEKA